jgi:antitoxin HicB
MNEKYIGSSFDSFLEEEGILHEVEQAAVKRGLSMRIREMMEEQQINKAEMARRMSTSRASLDRLLDPNNESVTLQTMNRAAKVLGKRIHLTIA